MEGRTKIETNDKPFTFQLAGLALLGLGIAVQLKVTEIVQIADFNLEVAPVTSMVVGGIVFFIAFFGCCGAIRESNCMLVVVSLDFYITRFILRASSVFRKYAMPVGLVVRDPDWQARGRGFDSHPGQIFV